MKKDKTKRILNCDPSPESEKDFTFKTADMAGFVDKVAIPPSVDLREKWWGINDQESTGSCVGWATADSVMRWHFVKKNLIKPAELLSVRFIWMASKETDEFNDKPSTFIEASGTSLKAALDVARFYGCVLDKELPFNSGELFGGPENLFYTLASRLKILNYINLIRGSSDKITDWKNWIAAGNGPILTRLNVDSTWQNASQTQGNLDIYDPTRLSGGHAVAIVGYTANRFIIRNSWGESWGDAGFAYASFNYAKAAFTEAYGINR